MKGKCGCSWASMNLLRQIKELLGMVEFELRHVYREANMVADSLGNQAVHDRCSVTHFSAKYLKGQHLLRNIRNVHPKCFRILIPWFEVVVANTKLLVGNGCTADFLCDNWLGTGPLLLRNSTVPLFFPKLELYPLYHSHTCLLLA